MVAAMGLLLLVQQKPGGGHGHREQEGWGGNTHNPWASCLHWSELVALLLSRGVDRGASTLHAGLRYGLQGHTLGARQRPR